MQVTTVNEALLQIAGELKDKAPGLEFTGWTRELLLGWWNDGTCILARMRPDLFSSTRIATLVPGSEQKVQGCDVFGRVLGYVNPDGTETPVTRGSFTASLAWTKPSCAKAPSAYKVKTFTFDPNQKSTFYVQPPVPPGVNAKVRVVCSGPPPKLTINDLNDEVDLDCYQFVMVKHYILAMAYMQDGDAATAALFQAHMSLWNTFLVGVARSDASFSGSAVPTPAAPPQQAAK